MRRTKRTVAVACGVMASWLFYGTPAAAQSNSWDGRGFLSVDGGYQASTTDFASTGKFTLYAEDGSLNADYKVKAGPGVNVRGGARVWRNLALGVGVTRFSRTHSANVTARLPHPFYFGSSCPTSVPTCVREVSGEVTGLTHEETAVHVEATWMIRLGDKVDVSAFGGPSYIQLKQDLVRQVSYTESYPYDTATFGGADKVSHTKAKVGFNVGADVAYMLTKRIGLGGSIRYTRVSLQLQPVQIAPDTGTVEKMDAGGAQAGGGLRVRF